MTVDFSLNDWIIHWKITFGHMALHTIPENNDEILIPLDEKLAYERDFLKRDIAREKDKKRKEKLQRSWDMTFGKGYGQITGGNAQYSALMICKDFGIKRHEWQEMSLKEKAMYFAAVQRENEIMIYNRLINNS